LIATILVLNIAQFLFYINLIAPAIVIYGVSFAIAIASDIAQLDCSLIAVAVILVIGALGLLQAHRDAVVEAAVRWSD
jgi:hypothetical protein